MLIACRRADLIGRSATGACQNTFPLGARIDAWQYKGLVLPPPASNASTAILALVASLPERCMERLGAVLSLPTTVSAIFHQLLAATLSASCC